MAIVSSIQIDPTPTDRLEMSAAFSFLFFFGWEGAVTYIQIDLISTTFSGFSVKVGYST